MSDRTKPLLQQSIGPSAWETMRSIDMQILREENERLRQALGYYAKPRTYGHGSHSVFVDDSGVAKAALGEKL